MSLQHSRPLLLALVYGLLVACHSKGSPPGKVAIAAADGSVESAGAGSTDDDTPITPPELKADEVARAPKGDWFPLLHPTADPPLGSVAPSLLWHFAPDGRWVVICEARHDTDGNGRIWTGFAQHGEAFGDALDPYLIVGSGPGEIIDDFVANTKDGRWIAFVRENRLILRDMSGAGHEEDLTAKGADPSTDDSPLYGHRAGTFDDAGRRFLCLRRDADGTSLVVRDLTSGGETVVNAGRDQVDRAFFSSDGRWVEARVLLNDSRDGGARKPPRPSTSLAPRRCRGRAASWSVWGEAGRTALRIARVGTDTALMDPPGELITTLGSRLLLRRVDGAIIVYREDRSVREWTPPSCHGRVLGVAPALDRVLVACVVGDKPEGQAELVGDSGRQPLGVVLSASPSDEKRVRPGRIVWMPQFAQDKYTYQVVDLVTGAVKAAPRRNADRIAATADRELIDVTNDITSDQTALLVLRDRRTAATQVLARMPFYMVRNRLVSGSMALWGSVVIDVAAGRIVGRVEFEAEPQVLRADGSVLVRYGDPSSDGMAGQYRWFGPANPDAGTN
jgi:hypothetical protein